MIKWAAAQPSPDPYQYAKFSPSMVIIVVVLIATLFFMGFFSIYIRHCSQGPADLNSVRMRGLSQRAAVAGLVQIDDGFVEEVLMAILEVQVERRSLVTRTEKNW